MTAELAPRLRVQIASLESSTARAVVCAALQLLSASDGVEVLLCIRGVEEPDAEQAETVTAWCLDAVSGQLDQMADVVFLGWSEALEADVVHTVDASERPADAARAIALLTAFAQSVWTGAQPGTHVSDASGDTAVAIAALARTDVGTEPVLHRQKVLTTIARRDLARLRTLLTAGGKPRVVLVFQHVSYWGAVEGVLDELRRRSDITFDVVALPSTADVRSGSSAAFLAARGIETRSAQWLLTHLDEIDVLVLDNPYDETRGPQLSATQLAERGIRLAVIPYGNNAIDGSFMSKLLWDMPLQRLAWRYYLGTRTQRSLYAQNCAAGDDPVRVLGSPRTDRLLGRIEDSWSTEVRARAGSRPIVLWNPHFRVEPGGWSTFSRYLRQVLGYLADHDDVLMVVRPHFRLFAQLRAAGLGALEQELRSAVFTLGNLVLDESADYLPALGVADAMLSDLSSLASDFHLTGRPLLYLHRSDGPGSNAEGSCFGEMDRADSWLEVQDWLDRLPSVLARRIEGAKPSGFPSRAAGRIADDLVTSLKSELGLLGDDTFVPAQPLRDDVVDMPAAAVTSPRRASLPSGESVQDWVLLSSFGGFGMGCNPRAIADELERVGHSARRLWVVRDESQEVPRGCSAVVWGSSDHRVALRRARWIVDNEALRNDFVRRPDQRVLQTWHGTPLKKLRWDLHEVTPRSEDALRDMEHDVAQWTHALSANPLTSEVLRRGFRFDGEILELGYPRNDLLVDRERTRERASLVRRALGLPNDVRVVLHAPTWRDDALIAHEGALTYTHRQGIDWQHALRVLPNTVVLFRGHRFVTDVRRHEVCPPGAVDVSRYPDMADLLAAADVLVTDYSSSFFDFALTGRPMVFFTPDLDLYRGSVRGHYFRMEDVVPGPVVRRAEEVVESLLFLDEVIETFSGRYGDFIATFGPWDDGKAAQRAVESIF